MEFYLFRLDEQGEPTKIPYDNAGYMDIAPDDRGETVRREICLMLEQMGIRPESSHHEEGPGQNEIDFRYSDPDGRRGQRADIPRGGQHNRGAERPRGRLLAKAAARASPATACTSTSRPAAATDAT